VDHRIVIDGAGKIVDELDNHFSQVISGCRLASEEEGSWHYLEIGILAQPVIKDHDPERVQQLALVFVYALDLTIEDAVGIDYFVRALFEPIDKVQLGFAFGF